MNLKIEKLKKEIAQLRVEKSERTAALPAHSVRPHQLMAIEELEEEIQRKEDELKSLEK